MSKFLAVVVLAVFAAGCGVKAQTYVMTKERADIEEPSGANAGYLSGSGEYKAPEKKTRKVYILEVSKPVPEGEVRKIEQQFTKTTTDVRPEEARSKSQESYEYDQQADADVPAPRKIVIPRIDDESAGEVATVSAPAVPAEGPKEAVTYTVLKDDTLQKIAKKFYNSYGKWVKIYEANKEKIKNPNFVRPGTVLTIPAVE
jgi:nucleoid-associated protein YgaU